MREQILKKKKESKKYATTKWKELLDILLSVSRDDVMI